MQLFLIKLGKAFGILRRDGLIGGGRRVFEGVAALCQRVKPGDVLFISGGVGDSSRYGCWHQAEELNLHGIKASVTVIDNPFLPSYADKFQVFIFHRTLFTPKVQKLIALAKQQHKEIIYATDDLVFDAQYFQHMDYLNNANKFEKKLYEKGVGEEILKDPYLKVCVTTTEFLQEKLESYGKQVFVSKNKLSQADLKMIDNILKNKPERNDGFIKIGYFSGTITHNKDFATIDEVLKQLLEKYSNLRLVIVGPLDINHKLNQVADQIEHLSFVPRDQHFANIDSVNINIAPLEQNNPFCQAKSELKFFEAGAVGVPTVASGTQTFQQAIADGVDGFVASTNQEWLEKLEQLIEDKALREQMGKNAKEKVMAQYITSGQGNQGYYDYLKSKIKLSNDQKN